MLGVRGVGRSLENFLSRALLRYVSDVRVFFDDCPWATSDDVRANHS